MKKKLLLIILALFVCVTLTGCGNESPKDTKKDDNKVEETDPTLGIVVKGKDNKLSKPVVLFEDSEAKVVFEDSKIENEGILVWHPKIRIENKTKKEQSVFITSNADWEYKINDFAISSYNGEKATFDEQINLERKANGSGMIMEYNIFEKIPLTIRVCNEEDCRKEVTVTVFATTIGGPYDIKDYSKDFKAEIVGEPKLGQTAKNPDMYGYRANIKFTNNSDKTVVVDGSHKVAPGESYTIEGVIGPEDSDKSKLKPNGTYSVAVFDEDDNLITTLRTNY